MSSFCISPPSDDEITSLTDWVEAILLLDEVDFISSTYVRDKLGEARLEEESAFDALIDLVLAEVSRRNRIAPHFYPFDRDRKRRGIRLKASIDPSPYEFLLWLSISQVFRSERRQSETEAPFNNLVASALTRYLGEESRVVHTAAGHKEDSGTFRELVARIASDMGLGYGGWQEPRTSRKDGGVDLVAWRPFADMRAAFMSVLCQCTVQMSWETKANDIDPRLWTQWINFIHPPLTALAIPFAVPENHEKWHEVICRVNLVFDRFRICEMAKALDKEASLLPYRQWCQCEKMSLYY